MKDCEYLTTGAAARILEVSENTVRKYEADCRLHAVRAGNLRLFRRVDVERLAIERRGRQ
jgi:excisionase family DNA binding protein